MNVTKMLNTSTEALNKLSVLSHVTNQNNSGEKDRSGIVTDGSTLSDTFGMVNTSILKANTLDNLNTSDGENAAALDIVTPQKATDAKIGSSTENSSASANKTFDAIRSTVPPLPQDQHLSFRLSVQDPLSDMSTWQLYRPRGGQDNSPVFVAAAAAAEENEPKAHTYDPFLLNAVKRTRKRDKSSRKQDGGSGGSRIYYPNK